MKQSNGHIEVQSALGRGSSFQVYLPAEAQACTDLDPARKPPSDFFRRNDTCGRRCGAVASSGLRGLESFGLHRAIRARSPGSSTILNQHKGLIHLLITDVIMPGMNGPASGQTGPRLRPEMKILYMTGYSGEFVRSDMLIPGVSFIQKPFTPADLRRKIRKMLSDKPATKAAASGS